MKGWEKNHVYLKETDKKINDTLCFKGKRRGTGENKTDFPDFPSMFSLPSPLFAPASQANRIHFPVPLCDRDYFNKSSMILEI